MLKLGLWGSLMVFGALQMISNLGFWWLAVSGKGVLVGTVLPAFFIISTVLAAPALVMLWWLRDAVSALDAPPPVAGGGADARLQRIPSAWRKASAAVLFMRMLQLGTDDSTSLKAYQTPPLRWANRRVKR